MRIYLHILPDKPICWSKLCLYRCRPAVGTVVVRLAGVVDFVVVVAAMEVDPQLADMVAAPAAVHMEIDHSAVAGMEQAAADTDQEAVVVEDRHLAADCLVGLDTALAEKGDRLIAAGSASAVEPVAELDRIVAAGRLADQVVDHAVIAAHFAGVKVVDLVVLAVHCGAVAGRVDQKDCFAEADHMGSVRVLVLVQHCLSDRESEVDRALRMEVY